MPTYSFLDVHASIKGPGGEFSLTSSEGIAEEGITLEAVEEKNSMTIGACGGVMHSLHASKAITATVRMLKTNPVNALLQNLYNYQTAASYTHGKNIIGIRDIARGDSMTITDAAFKNQPSISYSKDGNVIEWKFDGVGDVHLGFGSPAIV